MNYRDARPLIQSGDILAWRGTSFWSRLIRHGTAESYSHVGIAWVVGGRVFVLEAVYDGGVRCVPLSLRLPCYVVHTGKGLTEQQLTTALQAIGQRYSTLNAVLAWLKKNLVGTGKQCAQYVIDVLGLNTEPTPGDVVTTALEQGGVMRYLEVK